MGDMSVEKPELWSIYAIVLLLITIFLITR